MWVLVVELMMVSWATPIYSVVTPLSVVVVPPRTPIVVGLASGIIISVGWWPVRVMVAVSWIISTWAAITVRPMPPIMRSVIIPVLPVGRAA